MPSALECGCATCTNFAPNRKKVKSIHPGVCANFRSTSADKDCDECPNRYDDVCDGCGSGCTNYSKARR